MRWGTYRVFFIGPPLKVLIVRLHTKSHQKSSKCQNLAPEADFFLSRKGCFLVRIFILFFFSEFLVHPVAICTSISDFIIYGQSVSHFFGLLDIRAICQEYLVL